jgi:hypothetical protein
MSSKPNYRARAGILIIVSLIPGLVLSLFQNVDGSIVRQSAQNLIPVAGFLASAAIAMTFFYSGKLLDFISPLTPMVEHFKQPIRAFVRDAVKKGLEPLVSNWQDPTLVAEAFKDPNLVNKVLERLVSPFKQLTDTTELVVKFIVTSPQEITRNGSISFALLVSSAFFSVLAMLTGDALVLGVSLGILILGAGSLILGWFRAQDNLHAYLTGAYQLKVVLMALDLDKPPGDQ